MAERELKRLASPHYVLETKQEGDEGIVKHIVSVLGILDSHSDIIHSGAYKKTIAENFRRIRVLDNHRSESATDIVGSPIELIELSRNQLPAEVLKDYPQATGALQAVTRYNLNTQKGREIFELIKAGDLREYSVGILLMDYDIEDTEINGIKKRIRHIRAVKLIEYSNVLWGSNPATMTVEVKDDNGEVVELHYLPQPENSDAEPPNEADKSQSQTQANLSQNEIDSEDARLIKNALVVTAAQLAGPSDIAAARRIEKTLAQIFTPRQLKALSLMERHQLVRIHFYMLWNFSEEHDWWVHSVYDNFLTCFDYRDPVVGRVFAVDFTISTDETAVDFAPQEEWRAGRYEFVEQAAPPIDDADSTQLREEAAPSNDSRTSETGLDVDLEARKADGRKRLEAFRKLSIQEKP
jgi:HK97 family phage prohead protease